MEVTFKLMPGQLVWWRGGGGNPGRKNCGMWGGVEDIDGIRGVG